MSKLPWNELVPMISINPDAASEGDIARLAAELMEARGLLKEVVEYSKGMPTGLSMNLVERIKKILE